MSSWCPHCSGDRPTTATAAQSISIRSYPTDGGKRTIRRRRRFTSCSVCGRILKDRPYHNPIDIIHEIATAALNLPSSSSAVIIGEAHRIFIEALEKEEEIFAKKGRRVRTHVAAACLYVALRRHRQPHMLIHLSDYLGVTVYVLAAVFVALSTTLFTSLNIEWEQPPSRVASFIDPSLFMHRISSRVLGRKDAEVAATALRILSLISPRDWMLTTHNHLPIRICSAALYIAASRDKRISKSEVMRVVRSEMEAMESDNGRGQGLTMDEFVSRVTEIGTHLQQSEEEDLGLVCKHKNSRRPHCCYGLCRPCYHVFVKMSKGCVLQQPEAEKTLTLQNAKRQKIKHKQEEEEDDDDNDDDNDQELVTSDHDSSSSSSSSLLLDDIDDRDINSYINTEEEKRYKTIIWELMHQECIDEQSAKNMAAAAVLSAITSGDAFKARGEKKQRRGGAQRRKDTTAEGKSKDKTLSSRINYEVLSQLYQEQEKQSHRTKTDKDGAIDEHNNKKVRNGEDLDAVVAGNHDEADIDGDGKSSADNEADDYSGDYDEGGYSNEFVADDNEEYADDDFGF